MVNFGLNVFTKKPAISNRFFSYRLVESSLLDLILSALIFVTSGIPALASLINQPKKTTSTSDNIDQVLEGKN